MNTFLCKVGPDMLSVCDGATMALDDNEKPVIPINRVIVSLIEKTRVRIYWYRDVTWRPVRMWITPVLLRYRYGVVQVPSFAE
jgi:hypothetical protein